MAKIIVAEDEPGISMLITLTLQMEGYEVLQAGDGKVALQMVRDERPDLLLLDVMMPYLSGYEVAEALQKDPATVSIPIIFVTARGEIEDRIQGLDYAIDYVCKPFAVPELLARVRAALRTHALREELRVSNERLARLAVTDELTNLANRRGFLREFEEELIRARRFGDSLALLMFDLDHFKTVNDKWGHARGDTVLQQFARVLEEQSRRVDKIGRLGGEEFVALLPNTGSEGAATFAEKVRLATAQARIPVADEGHNTGDVINITVSAGVAVFDVHTHQDATGAIVHSADGVDNELIAHALLRVADSCLYQAKADGRNRWIARTIHSVSQLPIQETKAERELAAENTQNS